MVETLAGYEFRVLPFFPEKIRYDPVPGSYGDAEFEIAVPYLFGNHALYRGSIHVLQIRQVKPDKVFCIH